MPLLILFFVLFGLLLLVTPFLTIALFFREAKLRKQLNDLAEENAKQHTNCNAPSESCKPSLGQRLRPRRQQSRSPPHTRLASPIPFLFRDPIPKCTFPGRSRSRRPAQRKRLRR